MSKTNPVFSEFELRKMGFKFAGTTTYESVDCVGSNEEEMETKVITKKCRGIVRKKVVKGTGTGKIKLSAHVPYATYKKIYGMKLETLIEGVQAYGEKSVHSSLSIVQDVYDEDGNEKLKAYPNCVVETGIVRKIENGAEEVAEIELEVSVMPDEYGNGMYESLVEELTDESVKTKWMTEFTPSMVQTVKAQ